MFMKKLLNKLDKTARGTLAVGLAALLGATVMAAVLTGGSPKAAGDHRPTLRFRCMDFALIEDGSIQARVRLSVENMPKFNATGFNIKFNPYYIQPAYLVTKSGEKTQVLATDGSGGEHFESDTALMLKTTLNKYASPLTSEVSVANQGQYQINYVEQGKLDSNGEVAIGPGGKPELGKLSMYFELENKLPTSGLTTPAGEYLGKYPKSEKYTVTENGVTKTEYDLVQVMDVTGYRDWEDGDVPAYLYMDASGAVDAAGMDNYRLVEEVAASGSTPAKGHGQGTPGHGVNLGSITFKVNPDHLTEMVLNYNRFGASGAGATDLHEFLLGYRSGEETDANNAWFISDYVLEDGEADGDYIINKRTPEIRHGLKGAWNEDPEDEARVVIDFIFPKVLVKAEVAGGRDLTVNAYQAYGTGKPSDIAATVQRYRPEITATLADAMSTNYIMNWGDATPITTTRGGGYKVYRPYDAAKDGASPANLYIDRNHRDTPTDQNGWWVPLKDSEYDPRGGRYMVTQYFWYEEDGKTKMFPQPMEVCLTVTPVELVDVNAEGLTGTYSKTQAESFVTSDLTAFELPKEAVLSLAPVPGPIVLTMPITTWTPKSIGALTIANGQAQDWSAEGVYELTGPDAPAIKAYVKTTYPWVTTDSFNKGIKATRTVVADSGYSDVSYTAEWVSTTYTSNMTELRLRVTKKVDDSDASFIVDPGDNLPRFRTYLPGGLMIDTGTELPYRATGSTTQAANGAYSTNAVNSDADLYYVPGTAPRTAHQENVSRSINLGGWFYVSVCEELDGGNEKWSELLPVYVPPRTNYYDGQLGKPYYDPGAGTSDSHYLFDFTGPYAGLYPFYSNSVLPKNVVLPIGYTVGTTYDGFTGAEPGAVGQFWVEAWASAEENDLTHIAPSPSPWCATEPLASPQPKYNIISYGKPADPPATTTDEPLKPTDFKDAVYGNYGHVENHQDTSHATSALERVRVRVQAPEYVAPPATSAEPSPTPGPVNKPMEHIRLIHEDSVYSKDNIPNIDRDGNNEVTETTYTMRSTGYIQRETFTLTIVNDGTTDIYGLNVDVISGVSASPVRPTPAYTAEVDHHFEVLVPPAAYLPAGGSTTFVVTYANNLPDTDPTEKGTLYEDNILITSNAHDVTDPLKEYVANFEVMGDDTYKVTLEIRPDPDPNNDGVNELPDMGTAKLVVGPAPSAKPTLPAGTQPGDSVLIQTGADGTPPVAKPSENAAGDTYVAGHEYVWVKPEPNDEYKVKSIYYIDGYESDNVTEKRVNLYTYEWRDTGKTTGDAADSTMYFFKMPPKDVTVVVEYYEPIYAKLRMSQLMGYVGIDGEGTVDHLPNASFIDEGKRHNVRWYDDTTKIIQTDPNYTETENGNTIYVMTPKDSSRPKRPDYVIVLGDYANTPNDNRAVDDMTLVALRARLRKNILSPNIDDVAVEFRNYDLDTGNTTPMNSYSDGKTWHLTSGAPTYHNSYVFPAPPKSTDGKVTRAAVRITLKCTLTAAMIAEDPTYTAADVGRVIERHFVVVIVRPAAVESVQNYGNSPKGMIYNNTKISDAAKAAAWTNFKNSNYKFNTSNRPDKAAGLNNTYWKEAWGGITYAGDDADAANYDEDKYALFLLLGQSFQDPGFKTLVNSAGFNVDPAKIRRSVSVELLDTSASAATQRQRFNGAKTGGVLDTVVLNLGNGDKGLVTSATAGDVIKDWWKLPGTGVDASGNPILVDQAVRPGVYTLTYSFPDYNSDYDSNGNVVDSKGNAVAPIKVTRPVIILAPVGDVNADRAVDTADSGYIQNRVAEPLGCMHEPNSGVTLSYPAWRLFRYRCCDTNNDRNINNIDANQLIRKGTLVPYYKPTDYVTK